MTNVEEGSILWEPSRGVREGANLTAYMRWLATRKGLTFDSYQQLWRWSVEVPASFWHSLWSYFGVHASQEPAATLPDKSMPGARWFPGARLNYAENFFVRNDPDRLAIIYKAEDRPLQTIRWADLASQTAALAAALRGMGVGKGDRVVAYLPHIPETIIALFAVASLGAIWSGSSPDFGSRSVLDRFQQIEPKVLLAVDGYRYGGREYDRQSVVAELQTGLPSLEATVIIPRLEAGTDLSRLPGVRLWPEVLDRGGSDAQLTFEQVPFEHPLWVLYSSGTTGLPKPIVHGHGGILLEHLKMADLHLDLKPPDRFFWYTSTGWMMWNFLVGGLLTGCQIVVYDGSPGYPDLDCLWRLAEESGITYFGTSAAYIDACRKAGLEPDKKYDLSRIRALGSTGSPLSPEGFAWVYEHVNNDLALESISGGTDLCTAFVGGVRTLPVYAGELQAAMLGAKVEAYDPTGKPVVGEVGELVISEPMPSMPLYFWNDANHERYISSYFEMYPGVWRHGDWIKFTPRGTCVIYGRSDSTINRQGIRMGTSELYRVVESMPEVVDSLVVDMEMLGGRSYMPLFVVLTDGLVLDDDLVERIKRKVREDISPRHVPNDIFAIDEVPYTLSGKKLEVPIRRILLGEAAEKAANPGAMRNPESIKYFVELAEEIVPALAVDAR
jgi:acetoacetyl-CoA synthetase